MTWFFDIFCPHLPKSGDPGLTPQDAMQMLGSDCRGGQGWLNVEADRLEIREIKLWVSQAVWQKCWFRTMGPAWHASLSTNQQLQSFAFSMYMWTFGSKNVQTPQVLHYFHCLTLWPKDLGKSLPRGGCVWIPRSVTSGPSEGEDFIYCI